MTYTCRAEPESKQANERARTIFTTLERVTNAFSHICAKIVFTHQQNDRKKSGNRVRAVTQKYKIEMKKKKKKKKKKQ